MGKRLWNVRIVAGFCMIKAEKEEEFKFDEGRKRW